MVLFSSHREAISMQVLLVPSVMGKEHMSKLLVSQVSPAYCDMQAAMIKQERWQKVGKLTWMID